MTCIVQGAQRLVVNDFLSSRSEAGDGLQWSGDCFMDMALIWQLPDREPGPYMPVVVVTTGPCGVAMRRGILRATDSWTTTTIALVTYIIH